MDCNFLPSSSTTYDLNLFSDDEGKNKVLHGPLDWGHLNHEGYKLVSEFINIQIN